MLWYKHVDNERRQQKVKNDVYEPRVHSSTVDHVVVRLTFFFPLHSNKRKLFLEFVEWHYLIWTVYLLAFFWTGKCLERLVEGLHKAPLCKYNDKKEDLSIGKDGKVACAEKINGRITLIKKYFNSYERVQANRWFAFQLLFCELLNATNLAAQIYITNVFLNYQFFSLGINVLTRGLNELDNILAYVFPKITKCDFYKYGSSGSIQTFDALCVMALNIINEKVFLLLWFWYCLMIVVTAFSVLWRFTSFLLYSR